MKLGEIISARNFTPSRQVNPWAKSDDKFSELLSLDASGSLVRKDTRVPEPQKALTMMFDAFEAIRWATVFARWGEEFVIGHRSRAVDTPVVAILSESLQLKVRAHPRECRHGQRNPGDPRRSPGHKFVCLRCSFFRTGQSPPTVVVDSHRAA